jgi:hypothetical protein
MRHGNDADRILPDEVESMMRELNRDIAGLIAMAADYSGKSTVQIAEACDIALHTLYNKKSKKELPLLSFWAVAVIAKLAGKKIVFEDERR